MEALYNCLCLILCIIVVPMCFSVAELRIATLANDTTLRNKAIRKTVYLAFLGLIISIFVMIIYPFC